MSYHPESLTLQVYSYLFNSSIPKDDSYWAKFFAVPLHTVSLNSTFEHLTAKQVKEHTGLLNELFKQCLQRPQSVTSLEVLVIFIGSVCGKRYGNEKKDVLLRVFGGINKINDNFVVLLKLLKSNMGSGDDVLKFTSFKLFTVCTKSFYNTLVFEFLYQVDMSDEIYNLFLIEKLGYEIIGQCFATLAILNSNSLVSINIYKSKIDTIFTKKQHLSNIRYQLTQFLIFGTLFYYQLNPDLLNKKEQSSSFYNWVTFNRYNTKINDFKLLLQKDLKDESLQKFLKIKLDKFHNKGEFLKELIPVFLFLFSMLVNNDDLDQLITTRLPDEDDDLQILEIFLSLSSFILQYQHSYNSLLGRLSLMIVNKLLTSSLENLSNYYINQYRVKLCYQRQPIINPVGEIEYLDSSVDEEMVKNKNSLYYILDVVQCQYRYNLSKKLDLINYKLSNLIVLRVVNGLDFELNYNWHDFFKTLFQVLKFLLKNFPNDAKIGLLVEELLIIIELILIKFYQTDSKRKDLVEVIYKILENNEPLLLLKHYEKGNLPNSTIILELVITKFSSRIDSNYNEIYQDLSIFVLEGSEFSVSDNNLYEKIMKQDIEFEHDDTFKYLRMNNIAANSKISLVNKSIEEMVQDKKLFH